MVWESATNFLTLRDAKLTGQLGPQLGEDGHQPFPKFGQDETEDELAHFPPIGVDPAHYVPLWNEVSTTIT